VQSELEILLALRVSVKSGGNAGLREGDIEGTMRVHVVITHEFHDGDKINGYDTDSLHSWSTTLCPLRKV